MRIFSAVVFTTVTLAIAVSSAKACPLCLAPSQTWSEMIAAADIVILAELATIDEGSDSQRPFAIFQILDVHKGKSHIAKAKTIRIDDYVYGKKGDHYLIKAAFTDADVPEILETFVTAEGKSPEQPSSAKPIQKVSATSKVAAAAQVLTWDSPEPVTAAAWQYVTESPAPETAALDRLKYFLTFLEHKDSLVAADAWGEFAKSEYGDIKSLSDSFDTARLRGWIAGAETSPERLSLYGLMLGMSGTDDDAMFLQQQIGLPDGDSVRFGCEGLMGGLLVLSGVDGLKFLEESRLSNPAVATFEVYAVVQALQFLWNHEPAAIGKPRLRQAMHPLLQREELREIAIIDLARWEDWSLVDDLPAVYQLCKADDDRTTRAIVGYLLTLTKAAESGNDLASQQCPAANELLEQIRSENARLVKSVERQQR